MTIGPTAEDLLDDYRFLELSRSHWPKEHYRLFRQKLAAIWQAREQQAEQAENAGIITNYGVLYECGDYMEARAQVIEELGFAPGDLP